MKFRVWDKVNKEFIKYGFYLDMNGRFRQDYYSGTIPVEDPDRYVVQVCIGMKDKDGQEIYAGDIVEGTWIDKDDDKHERFVVQEIDGCYPPFTEPTGDSSGWLYSTSCWSGDFEVIGNEFENPELVGEVSCT